MTSMVILGKFTASLGALMDKLWRAAARITPSNSGMFKLASFYAP
jgi:hypothetical protein